MSNPAPYSAIGRQLWLQHHLPWLAVLGLFVGLFRDDAEEASDFDDWPA